MTFNFLRPGLTVNVEAKVQEQIILDSSGLNYFFALNKKSPVNLRTDGAARRDKLLEKEIV